MVGLNARRRSYVEVGRPGSEGEKRRKDCGYRKGGWALSGQKHFASINRARKKGRQGSGAQKGKILGGRGGAKIAYRGG